MRQIAYTDDQVKWVGDQVRKNRGITRNELIKIRRGLSRSEVRVDNVPGRQKVEQILKDFDGIRWKWRTSKGGRGQKSVITWMKAENQVIMASMESNTLEINLTKLEKRKRQFTLSEYLVLTKSEIFGKISTTYMVGSSAKKIKKLKEWQTKKIEKIKNKQREMNEKFDDIYKEIEIIREMDFVNDTILKMITDDNFLKSAKKKIDLDEFVPVRNKIKRLLEKY
jgi:hypothetical protein